MSIRGACSRGLPSLRRAARQPPGLIVRLARCQSTAAAASADAAQKKPPRARAQPASVLIRGQAYDADPAGCNVPPNVLDATSRQLHLQRDHPLAITRQLIESHFPAPAFRHYSEHGPVVSTHQNFDSLGFPPDHPGRARSDTYYINQTTLLRTHTSAHQAETFGADASDGYLISADVYRRDEIDRSHYPVFHQMEGARSWDWDRVPGGDVAAAVRKDLELLSKHDAKVKDPNPPFHPERNPLQQGHSADEVKAVGSHLKRSLENMVVDIFSRAQAAAPEKDADLPSEPLRMRWVEAYFPFTSPSWELEVWYEGRWLEVLGCGVVKQDLFTNAGVPSRMGWAFGLGLERIAMLLFKIPDIRLFWSRDQRFLSQFSGVSDQPDSLRRFKMFSKYPPCVRDVSFWLPPTPTSAAGGNSWAAVHVNDVMELVRSTAGDDVESVKLCDEFVHPDTGRESRTYRIVYRNLERTLVRSDATKLHGLVKAALVDELGVEIR